MFILASMQPIHTLFKVCTLSALKPQWFFYPWENRTEYTGGRHIQNQGEKISTQQKMKAWIDNINSQTVAPSKLKSCAAIFLSSPVWHCPEHPTCRQASLRKVLHTGPLIYEVKDARRERGGASAAPWGPPAPLRGRPAASPDGPSAESRSEEKKKQKHRHQPHSPLPFGSTVNKKKKIENPSSFPFFMSLVPVCSQRWFPSTFWPPAQPSPTLCAALPSAAETKWGAFH